jgi:hypothetical protein
LVVLPTVIFAVPAMLGHPAIAQDNFIQNYPLRVLTGQQIASGHLPLLNPLANSGTPLLGGMNAGSFYPLTWLFVFLPPLMAWVINLIAVYVTAAIGVYSLCRWHHVRASASLIAALTFAYAGAMMGQIVHLAVVQGYALLPWMVLTELVVARRLLGVGDERSLRRHVIDAVPAIVGFAVIWALTFLSGEPRAIAEMELVALVVCAVELVMHNGVARATWRGRILVVGANVIGAGWGAAMALAQLLPGWAFIAHSERAGLGYSFFGSGSLVVRWSSLLLDQDLFGGNGVAGTPSYFTNYNLAEVTGYAGIIALTAIAAYFAQLTRRGWTEERRTYAVYGVLFVVGLFATWGSFTPLGHLFHLLPLFGKTRLQSRNFVVVDLAAAVLLGWWLDAVFAKKYREASLEGRRRLVSALPALTTVALMVAMLSFPARVQDYFGSVQHPNLGRSETVTVLLHLAISLGVLAVLFRVARRWQPRRWLIGLFIADLLVFNVFCDVGFGMGSTPNLPTHQSAVAVLGDRGRFAIIDPGQSNIGTFEQLGLPNLNVFSGLAGVQGYGSLVDSKYGKVTGTHPLASLDPCNLARGVFAQLRLNTLVLSASSLSKSEPLSAPFVSCGVPRTQQSTRWYFGQLHQVQTLVLTGVASNTISHSELDVRFIDASGHFEGPDLFVHPSNRVVVAAPARLWVAGVAISSPLGVTLSRVEIHTLDALRQTFDLTSPLEAALSSGQWQLHATTSRYSIFHATSLRPAQWLENKSVDAKITHVRSATWGDQWITVRSAAPVTLVRSVSWLAGWRADAVNSANGHSVALIVRRHGLIQRVVVPAGTWQIHFHYHAPYIELGVIVSILATLLMAAAVLIIVRPRVREWLRGSVSP